MSIDRIGFPEDNDFLWDMCSSPNCYRIPEPGQRYCCAQCRGHNAHTYDQAGHGSRCNNRHADIFRLDRRTQRTSSSE